MKLSQNIFALFPFFTDHCLLTTDNYNAKIIHRKVVSEKLNGYFETQQIFTGWVISNEDYFKIDKAEFLPYNNPLLPYNKSKPPYNNYGLTSGGVFLYLCLRKYLHEYHFNRPAENSGETI